MNPAMKIAGDGAAYGTAIAVWTGYAPSLAATFTILWLACQIYGFVQNQIREYRRSKGSRRRKSDAK